MQSFSDSGVDFPCQLWEGLTVEAVRARQMCSGRRVRWRCGRRSFSCNHSVPGGAWSTGSPCFAQVWILPVHVQHCKSHRRGVEDVEESLVVEDVSTVPLGIFNYAENRAEDEEGAGQEDGP